jgi:nicotinate-nucleotide adenylyltransferase
VPISPQPAGSSDGEGAPTAPLPIPKDARAILLVGGMFDPPHRAHVALASRARDRAVGENAWLVFVPAACSPLKASGPVAPDADRLKMLQIATQDLPRSAVWTDEIDRAASRRTPSFWVDTLERGRTLLGEAVTIRFFIGSDQAAHFHQWRRPRDILRLAAPIVVPRSPFAAREDLLAALRATGFWTQDELASWGSYWLDAPLMEISSTALRADPATPGDIDPRVLKYIRQHALYR